MPSSESLLSEQAAFAKHLFTQGYPLWSPDPALLPAVRQSVGLRIGDVGTVDERGRFDVFFNILEPPPGISDSLQLIFPPLVENDTRCVDQDILPREVVSSPETPWDVDQLDVLTVADISRRTTQYSATLSDDGSHIILPQGAQLFELQSQHRKIFESHAREHGAEWLELFKDRLGWPRSNSLYLLTGFYKTCSWSIASFGMQTAANTNPVYVHCTLVEVDERTIREESVWHPAGRFKRKIGPAPNRQGQNNQAVFIRGITITPNVSRQGQIEDQHATSTLLSRLIAPIPFLNMLVGSNQATAAQTPGSNVIIQHVPPISQARHPSEVINQHLLTKEPSARIAVTHDSQWISMLEKGRSWKLEDLENHIDTLVSERYSIARHNSTVYMRDKEHRSPTHIAVEQLPLSSGMQLSASGLQERQHALAQHSGSFHDHRSSPSSDNDFDYINVHPEQQKMEVDVDDDRNTVLPSRTLYVEGVHEPIRWSTLATDRHGEPVYPHERSEQDSQSETKRDELAQEPGPPWSSQTPKDHFSQKNPNLGSHHVRKKEWTFPEKRRKRMVPTLSALSFDPAHRPDRPLFDARLSYPGPSSHSGSSILNAGTASSMSPHTCATTESEGVAEKPDEGKKIVPARPALRSDTVYRPD